MALKGDQVQGRLAVPASPSPLARALKGRLQLADLPISITPLFIKVPQLLAQLIFLRSANVHAALFGHSAESTSITTRKG
jgi:hypothetical protein